MKKIRLYLKGLGTVAFSAFMLVSCESFIDPEQELILTTDEMFADWGEYRSASMGLYALQQELVEQIVILGELRADLLQVTENASPELIEISNFSISRENPYASPINFYKLIAACNKLIRQLKSAHPDVLDNSKPVSNYDRLYGEVLCMRAWAYFNAVRIYNKVPYINEILTDAEDIENYVNSGSSFTVPEYIYYAPDGYHNDTIRDTTIVLTKQFLDLRAVIDTFTTQLVEDIKATGVNHSMDNGDVTWMVTTWNNYARHALLGQMFLFDGNYGRAIEHFNPVLYDNSSETAEIRYGLDAKFRGNSWKNIFRNIEPYEHIFTLWFGKSYQQTNDLQSLFSIVPPNNYMVKADSSMYPVLGVYMEQPDR
jgi:starch-binding outer membrane protein, SusD/RagB family